MKIYIANLSADILPHAKTILSATDRMEASRFSDPVRCSQAKKSRIIRRQILSHELQCPASEIDYIVTNGKPGIAAETRLQFSISYSGSLMAMAVSDEPIGVDLEEIDVNASNEDVVETLFHCKEIQQISCRFGIDRIKAFYTIWTQKEAFAKALGKGMEIEFKNFAVLLEGGNVTGEETVFNGDTWYTKPLPIKDNFTLAIASRSLDPQIVVVDWPTESDLRFC